MKRLLPFALLVTVIAIALHLSTTHAQDKKPPQTPDDFTGKVVVFYLKDGSSFEHVLENVEIKEVAGRVMAVGKNAETGEEENWAAGARVAIAWDLVEACYAMSKEQLNQSIKKRSDRQL